MTNKETLPIVKSVLHITSNSMDDELLHHIETTRRYMILAGMSIDVATSDEMVITVCEGVKCLLDGMTDFSPLFHERLTQKC